MPKDYEGRDVHGYPEGTIYNDNGEPIGRELNQSPDDGIARDVFGHPIPLPDPKDTYPVIKPYRPGKKA